MASASAQEVADAHLVSADDLDREQIEQLHAATLKASGSCFELKQLCATVLVPSATLVSVVTDKRLSDAVFLSGIVPPDAGKNTTTFRPQRRLARSLRHSTRRWSTT